MAEKEEKEHRGNNNREEDNSSNNKTKIPLICGMLCLVSITALLMITEWMTDASVMLLRWRLCMLCICILPFVMMNVGNNVFAKIVSIISLICVLALCVTMYYDRNEVIKMYSTEQNLGDAQTEQIKRLMRRPVVVLLGVLRSCRRVYRSIIS